MQYTNKGQIILPSRINDKEPKTKATCIVCGSTNEVCTNVVQASNCKNNPKNKTKEKDEIK